MIPIIQIVNGFRKITTRVFAFCFIHVSLLFHLPMTTIRLWKNGALVIHAVIMEIPDYSKKKNISVFFSKSFIRFLGDNWVHYMLVNNIKCLLKVPEPQSTYLKRFCIQDLLDFNYEEEKEEIIYSNREMCPTENWVGRIVGKGISTIPLKKSRDQFEEELSAPSFVGSFLAPTPTY